MRRLCLILPLLALTACASRPPIDSDPTLMDLERRAAQIRPQPLPPIPGHDVRRSYEALAQSTENDGLKAMALQRLADLELDRGSAQDAARPAGEETIGGAIRQYERLLALYPDYAGNDRVLYQLARAYELNGEPDKTLAVLTRLVTKYPYVANREEIQFRRGELLFAGRDFEEAEKAYGSIIANGPGSAFYDRALFKQGWSIFKQGQTARSLRAYFGVLDRSFADGRRLADFSRSERELLDDTLRIVSLSFSYLKGPASVAAFFDDYGERDYAFQIYERLGDLYLTQGRPDDAALAFHTFVERHPRHRQAPLFLLREIAIYQQAPRLTDLLRAKADLITAYGIGTPFWEGQASALLAELTPHLKRNLDDLSRYYHAQAQTNKKPADYRIAAHWYRRYVDALPADPGTPHRHLLLAEALQAAGDMAAAAEAFAYTAYGYAPHADSAEAGYAALLAERALVDGRQGEARSRQRRAAIAAAKRFVTYFPQDSRAAGVMSKTAEELLDLKDYPQAAGTAYYVVGMRPEPAVKLRRINWGIIAVAEFELGEYAHAEAASLERLRLADGKDPDRQAYVERLAAAIYKQGEQAREAGLHGAAARHFLRVEQLAPGAAIRANALFDGAAELVAKQDWALAIPVLKEFVKRYPGHKLYNGAYQMLALSYEKSGDWAHAAEAFQVLYRGETNGERKRLMLWQTAEYYQKAGRPLDAAEIYKQYIRTFRLPFDDAIEAHQRLAEIYRQSQDVNSRRYWLRKLIARDAEEDSTPRSTDLAATASLELAGVGFADYERVHLVPPLKTNLKKKKALLQASIEAYTAAAAYGIEAVTTAATYQIAEIYHGFSRELLQSERPKGLSAEELEQYDILLEEQAYPFEEKAIEVHELNARRTVGGVYDQWVRKSFGALGKLNPIRYAKQEKSEVIIDDIH